jgi:undecaprenyl-diphosphatase
MAAATGLDLVKSSFAFTPNEFFILMVGFSGAFVSATVTVKFLINFVQKHDFKIFAYYRIVLAILFWSVIR